MRLIPTPGPFLRAQLQTAATVLVLAAASCLAAHADPVITQGATPTSGTTMLGPTELTGPVYATVGWTTGSFGYSGVNIDALLYGGDGTNVVDAYLTTAAGPGSTSATLVAEQPITFFYTAGYATITLFSGLSLDANTTYYLTIAPETDNYVVWGIDGAQPAPTLDTGVTELAATYCGQTDCAAYPPASSTTLTTDKPIFSVTGDRVSPVPEPATLPLFATGLGLAGILRRRLAKSSLTNL